MSNDQKIEIIIDKKTGEISFDASGFQGQKCNLAINDIAKLLGKTVKSVRKTGYDNDTEVNISQSI